MAGGDRETGPYDPFRSTDQRIAALAAVRHCVLDLDDLARCGVSAEAARRRAQRGRLHRVHRGVYSLVPRAALSVNGRRLAAVLACRTGAALGARSAADQLGVRRTIRAGIDVIVPATNRTRGHDGIDLHRSRTLTPADVVLVDAIPTTTVARTLLDLAPIVRAEELERALNQAEVLRIFDLRSIEAQLARNPRHPGAGRLRAALAVFDIDAAPTESVAEDDFLRLLRLGGLPEPERQVPLVLGAGEPPARVDFLWRAARVVVEIDRRQFHGTRAAFEDDRRRDALLQAAGWRVLRFTARQLRDDPSGSLRILVRLLVAEAA